MEVLSLSECNQSMTAPSKPNGEKQGISSLEIGLRILETVSEYGKPITLTALSELSQLSPSRLHKYLVSLSKMGYVAQLENSQYTLSTSSIKIGTAALRLINPVQIAFDYADKLHQEYDRTVTITIWNGNAPLVIKWLDSSRTLAVNVRLGAQLSPFTSASGRIFLAFLPNNRRNEIVNRFFKAPPALPRHMGNALDKESFLSLLDTVKKENVCRFKEDFLPDINVISAPVFDVDGNVSTVISLLGQSSDTPVDKGSIYEQAITKAADDATKKIRGFI